MRALKQKKYPLAKQNLAQSVRGPITDLAATLLGAWASYGANDAKGAIEAIDKLQGAEWYALFKDLHAGLILDLSGNKKEAGKRFERAHKLDATALRLVEAYGSWLSRNGKARTRRSKCLQRVRRAAAAPSADRRGDGGAQAQASRCRRWSRRRRPARPKCYTAWAPRSAGAAARIWASSTCSLRSISRRHQPLALLSLADLYEQMKNPQLAIKVYEHVPQNSPLRRNAEIQLAANLDTLDRTDEAKQRLQKLITERPDDVEAIMALGNILRGRKMFDECAKVYSKGIATIANPERPNWLIFYFRGICNERAKKWQQAEADLKQALKLFPDQPHVLNYLGYSWIDQGMNLDEGMRMIRRAVEQRPDDGYIVDSLGWAHYRARQLRRGGEESRARGRAQARRSDHQRSSRRRLLEDRTGAGGAVPVGACARSQARAGRPRQDQEEARSRPRRGDVVLRVQRSPRSPATAADRAAIHDVPPGRQWRSSDHAPAKVNLTLAVLGRRARRLSCARQPGGVRASARSR